MSTPRVLIINPNTTASVTDRLTRHAREALPGAHVDAATAHFGARYIASEAAYTVAAHAVLDTWAAHAHEDHDAVLIGCFGDPGLTALEELCPAHVVGLATASMRAAAGHGRFAVVTGGARWQPMLERLSQAHGLATALAGIEILPQSGLDLQAGGDRALTHVRTACERAAARWQVDAILVGGAALAGWGDRLAPHFDLPVLDSVSAGMAALREVCTQARPQRVGPDGAAYVGISPALVACMQMG
ncbi:MAG: aspartate/glutamate racemase family protein [Rhodocyclaceae bacterium]